MSLECLHDSRPCQEHGPCGLKSFSPSSHRCTRCRASGRVSRGWWRSWSSPKVVDLLWHLPSGLVDRRSRPKIAEVRDGEIATMEVTVGLHVPPRTKRLPYRVHVSDETGEMQIIFFNARADYLNKVLPEGGRRIVSGRVEFYQGAPR